MAYEEFALIAKQRFNDKLDLKTVYSKDDYQRRLEAYLNQSDNGKRLTSSDNWDSILEACYSSVEPIIDKREERRERLSKRDDKVEASKTAVLLSRARRFEAKRPSKSRIRDEKKTAKDTRIVSKKTYTYWRRGGYRRMDIRGVDTRMPRSRVSRHKSGRWRKKK